MFPPTYRTAEGTPEEIAERDRVHGALTEATRQLALAQLQTTVDLDEVAAVTDELEALTARLRASVKEGSYGAELGPKPAPGAAEGGRRGGRVRNFGNAVVGLRNPLAAVVGEHGIVWNERGATATFHLNALYEGPPGLVHGGVSALLLDQICGEAAAAAGHPGMTGRLTLTYRRPTPLGDLSMEAWLDSRDGIKTTVKGHLKDADGNVTVEAEGLFILPRWAREQMAKDRTADASERVDTFE